MERKGLRHSVSEWLSHWGKRMKLGGMNLSVEIFFRPVGVEREPRKTQTKCCDCFPLLWSSLPPCGKILWKWALLYFFNALPFSGLDYLFPKTELRWSLSWADLTKKRTSCFSPSSIPDCSSTPPLYHLCVCCSLWFNSLPWQRSNPGKEHIGFLAGFNEAKELREGCDVPEGAQWERGTIVQPGGKEQGEDTGSKIFPIWIVECRFRLGYLRQCNPLKPH